MTEEYAYSYKNTDKKDYCIGWSPPPCNHTAYMLSPEAWKFTTTTEITGVPIWGKFAMYEGNGYVANLDVNKDVSVIILRELKDSLW